jgi:hypothetical protein
MFMNDQDSMDNSGYPSEQTEEYIEKKLNRLSAKQYRQRGQKQSQNVPHKSLHFN